MRGPIDYIIVGFDGSNFTGQILAELRKAIDAGVIAVLSLMVVAKDKNGATTTIDLNKNTLEITKSFELDNSLVTDDDIAEVGSLLESEMEAGLLVVEHLWAIPLKQAIVDSGGHLIVDGRVHPDASEDTDEEKET